MKDSPDKPNILIVEDELDALDMYTAEFDKEHKFDIFVARTGREAKKLLGQYDFDLILLDLLLIGDTDGFAIMEYIKEQVKKRQMKKPIIFVFSNLMENGNAERTKKLGAEKFILKSKILPKEIYKMVKERLKVK